MTLLGWLRALLGYKPVPILPPPETPSRRVLIVDDDHAIARSIARMLAAELEGATVEAACGAPEALALHHAAPYAVIVTDLAMPGGSGAELVRRLRERRSNVRVVLVSGHAADDLAAIARQCGASAWLPKPLEIDALIATVKVMLTK